MWVAWDHNPQGEFHEAGVIHWREWAPIGVLWAGAVFAVVFVPVLVLASADRICRAGLRKLRGN
jgi:hypothetical protein